MRILDGLLFFGLLCTAVLLVRFDIQEARQLRASRYAFTNSFDVPGPFQFIEGRDTNGALISVPPSRFKKLVFFVLHGRRFESDVAFWNAAGSDKADLDEVGFVGVCDGTECAERLLAAGTSIRFISINAGDYLAMKTLLRADAQGKVVVMNLPGGKMYKSAYPKSVKELAELRAVPAK